MKIRVFAAALGALLLAAASAAPAAACEVCYGAAARGGSPLVTSARTGVFLLLAITFVILGAFARFFLYLRKQAQRAEILEIEQEWSQLQRSAST